MFFLSFASASDRQHSARRRTRTHLSTTTSAPHVTSRAPLRSSNRRVTVIIGLQQFKNVCCEFLCETNSAKEMRFPRGRTHRDTHAANNKFWDGGVLKVLLTAKKKICKVFAEESLKIFIPDFTLRYFSQSDFGLAWSTSKNISRSFLIQGNFFASRWFLQMFYLLRNISANCFLRHFLRTVSCFIFLPKCYCELFLASFFCDFWERGHVFETVPKLRPTADCTSRLSKTEVFARVFASLKLFKYWILSGFSKKLKFQKMGIFSSVEQKRWGLTH